MEDKAPFSYKTFFKNYGLFLAILAVIFLILIYTIHFTRAPFQNNLKTQVVNVLNEKQPDTWIVGNSKSIENPFCLNAALYEAKNRKDGDFYSIIIIRIQTFYGPVAAVFSINKDNYVDFIGYSSLHGRVEHQLLSSDSDIRLDYWKKKIPDIIGIKE